MKRLLSISAVLLLLAAPICAETVIFQDDFETQDFSAWSGSTAGNPFILNGGAGVITTTRAHSGFYSFAATLPATGNYVKAFAGLSNLGEVYYQFWFYVDPAWSQGTHGVAIMEISGGGEVILGPHLGGIYLLDANSNWGTHAVSTGVWHSLQIHNKTGSGTGVETVTLDGAADINLTNLTIAGPFTRAYIGFDNASGQSGTIYFDDAQIATGGALSVPSANITVRYPNTNARTAFPVDVVMWGVSSSDILVASVDSSTVYTQTGSMTQHQRFTVSLNGLTAGSHTFQVQLQNSGSTPKATFTGSFTVYLAGTPTVAIDAANNISRNGSPFFFVAPFLEGSSEWANSWLSNSSVNTYGWEDCFENNFAYTYSTLNSCMNTIGYPFIGPDNSWTGESSTEYAANQPGATTTAAEYVVEDEGNSNLFMWAWQDEPDGGTAPGKVLPATMLLLAETVWANDGNHPVITNLEGGTSAISDRQHGWYYPLVPNSSSIITDVYSDDMYPFIYQYAGNTVTQMAASFDWEQNYTYHLVPTTAFIEVGICSSGGACTGYGPTAAEVDMEAWLGVIHGLKGISWWGPSGWTSQDSAHWTAAAQFVSQATTLAPVILSPNQLTVTSNQTTLGARVDATGRQVDTTITVFAARLTDVDAQTITNVAATSSLATYTVPNYFSVGETVAVYGLANSALDCTAYSTCVVASLIGSGPPYTGFTIAGTWPSISSRPDSGTAVGNDSTEETQALSTTLTVSGSSFTGMAAVLNESRTASVTDGVITDTFNSYATHIYQLSGPYTLSTETTGTGTGTVTNCAGAYSGGAFFSCTVTAGAGSYIASVSGCGGSGTTTYSGTMPSSDCTVTATVTQSVFSLAATTPATVNPGAPATSTITVSTATGYAGTVTITCALTSYPSGATDVPTCSNGNATVTLTSTTATGTATVTVGTTAASASLAWPQLGPRRGWDGTGSGAILALLVFLGIPARRRSWRSLIGMLVLMVALGSMAACGGSGGGGGSTGPSNPGTTAGTYTFTVTGTGSPSITPIPTTTFTLTVN
jgi:hypothetical protein